MEFEKVLGIKGTGKLGYRFLSKYWGKGIGTSRVLLKEV